MSDNRKYCNICSNKFSPRTFEIHRTVCRARKINKTISLPCICCEQHHNCSYGSGAYCSKQCMYKDRKRYNKTCTKCKLPISVNNYNNHVLSCKGPKFNVDIWKVSENNYKCPICNLTFNKMGIASHYAKIHGKLPKLEKSIKHKTSTKKYSNCITCNNKLHGRQRKYCSNKCKFSNSKISNNSYKSQRRRSIKKKLKLVLKFGGKCQRCGYNKNLASLCFHHINENEKKFNLDSRTIAGMSFEASYAEAKKCELLCHNCHAEHHNADLELSSVMNNFSFVN